MSDDRLRRLAARERTTDGYECMHWQGDSPKRTARAKHKTERIEGSRDVDTASKISKIFDPQEAGRVWGGSKVFHWGLCRGENDRARSIL